MLCIRQATALLRTSGLSPRVERNTSSGSRMERQVLRWHLTMDLLVSDSKDNLLKFSDPALELGLQLMLYVPHTLLGVI